MNGTKELLTDSPARGVLRLRLNRPGREIVERRTDYASRTTYQLERIRCGKPTCRCARGAGHGPYWYAYWSEGGKTRSKYIGKQLPTQQSQTHTLHNPGDET